MDIPVGKRAPHQCSRAPSFIAAGCASYANGGGGSHKDHFPRPRSSLLRIAKIAHAVPNKPAETLKASAVVASHPFSSRAKYVHIGSTKFSHAIKTQAHKNPSFSNTRTELYIVETYLPHLL